MGQQAAIGQWIQKQLDRREWTQADLARRLDVDSGQVSRWVKGDRVPSPRYCDLLADVFGASVDAVLSLAGHRPSDERSDPDEPRTRIIALAELVDWKQPGRLEAVEGLMRMYREDDRRRTKQ